MNEMTTAISLRQFAARFEVAETAALPSLAPDLSGEDDLGIWAAETPIVLNNVADALHDGTWLARCDKLGVRPLAGGALPWGARPRVEVTPANIATWLRAEARESRRAYTSSQIATATVYSLAADIFEQQAEASQIEPQMMERTDQVPQSSSALLLRRLLVTEMIAIHHGRTALPKFGSRRWLTAAPAAMQHIVDILDSAPAVSSSALAKTLRTEAREGRRAGDAVGQTVFELAADLIESGQLGRVNSLTSPPGPSTGQLGIG